MNAEKEKSEGGLLPLAILLGLMLLVLGYGVSQGFLKRAEIPANKKIQLTVIVQPDPNGSYERVVQAFEQKHPEVSVQIVVASGQRYYQKLLVMMASGNPPDLMWMGQGFGEFAQRGAFLDVASRIKQDVDVSRFIPQSLEWYKFGDQQLGIPFRLDVGFIIYNKDIFDQAGLPYPTNAWDYDRFFDLASRLTVHDKQGRTTRFGYFGSLDDALFGAQFISDDGTQATCDTPQMIEALQTNNALINRYHIAPNAQQHTSLDRYFLFASGRAAMMQAYTWDLPSLHQQAGSVRWGYVLNPRIAVQTQWASSQAILISAQTKHPEMAWALCKEFLAPEFQKMMASNALPSDIQVAQELAESGQPQYDHLPVLLAAIDRLVALPRVAHFTEAQTIMDGARDSVYTGQTSARQAVERAARLMNRMLNEQRRYGS